MMRVDRARVHRRDQVQAHQDQLPLPQVAVTTGPLLIGAGVRGGAEIDMGDSSLVLDLVGLVAPDLLSLCGGTYPSVGSVTAIIRVSACRVWLVLFLTGRQATMRESARIEPLRVNPLVEVTTGIRLLPLELVLGRLQDKPNRAATSVVGPQVRLEFTP